MIPVYNSNQSHPEVLATDPSPNRRQTVAKPSPNRRQSRFGDVATWRRTLVKQGVNPDQYHDFYSHLLL
jgi:hypothetical protein